MQRVGTALFACLGALSAGNAAVIEEAVAKAPGSFGVSMSPVTRIVELLKALQAQATKDAESDESLYEKFVCWGREVIRQKEETNMMAEKEISELSQYISDLGAGRIELTTERVDLEKEIAEVSNSIEIATAQRDKEKADYENAVDEMTQAIDALNSAIAVMKTATEGHETGTLLSLRAKAEQGSAEHAAEAGALHHAVELGNRFLTKGDALFLRRVLIGEVPEWDWKKLNRKATFKMSYKARSFKIQDVLAKLLETFTSNKEEAIEKETEAQNEFNKLMTEKQQEKSAAQEALRKMEKENGAKTLSKADAQEQLDSYTEQVANDKKYIEQVKNELAEKKTEWTERKTLRYNEIQAISKAIAILHNDDARDLFKRSLSSQGYLFLQTGKRTSEHDAVSALRAAARKSHDQRLSALATQVATAAPRFDEVIVAIDNMVSILKAESASDLEEKESCEDNRAKDTRDAIKDSREIDENTDTMTSLESSIAKLQAEVEELGEQIVEIDKQIDAANRQRDEEKAAYQAERNDDQEAATTVQNAQDVLVTFYKENMLMLLQHGLKAPVVVGAGEAPPPPPTTWDAPYGGKTPESTGVIAILGMIKEDINRDISKCDAAELKAAEEHAEAVKALTEEKNERQIDINDMESTIGTHSQDLVDTKDSRKSSKGTLDALLAKIQGAEPGCNYFTINFPLREKNRQTEIDGLMKARGILEFYFSDKEDGDALLQKVRKHA